MPAQDLTPEVDRQGIQHYTLEMDQTRTHRKLNKEEKMDMDRTHAQETSITITRQTITWNPQGKGETHRKETEKGKQKRWVTPRERWRGWPRTDNSGVPWSMAYAPSEQTGISK